MHFVELNKPKRKDFNGLYIKNGLFKKYWTRIKLTDNHKLKHFTFLLLVILLYSIIKTIIKKNNIIFNNRKNIVHINQYKIEDLFNVTIKKKSIIIFEPNSFHYECTPGYSKFFIDLGYNVDIIMNKKGKDSFCLFDNQENIRFFIYKKKKQITFLAKSLIKYINKYSLLIVQSVFPFNINIINKLGLFRNNKVVYILHNTKYYQILSHHNISDQNRIWTLGQFSIGLQVNPHYFGKIKIKDKNERTRFFIFSSSDRNYNYIISAAEKIKNENFKFEICVAGYRNYFSEKDINETIKDNFIFNYRVNYPSLYKMIDSSDYIIINLDPDINKVYKDKKSTGAIQLSLGFKKPPLINNYFKDAYNMSKENSFLFEKTNFYDVMKNAILLNNIDYKNMQNNLIQLEQRVYDYSLLNIKKTLNHLF